MVHIKYGVRVVLVIYNQTVYIYLKVFIASIQIIIIAFLTWHIKETTSCSFLKKRKKWDRLTLNMIALVKGI